MSFRLTAPLFVLSFSVSTAETTVTVPKNITEILGNYCTDCHEEGTEKGEVRLDNLMDLPLDGKLEMMNRMYEKVYFEEMPPKKKDQPTADERKQMMDWLSSTLRANNASKLEEKMRHPEYGNKIDHTKLFSGEFKNLPAYTPDRRWLISEFIFNEKFNKLVNYAPTREIDGKRMSVIGDNNRKSVNLTNPFLLPTHSGVRYYDTTTLDGGHLLTMLGNAREVSKYLIEQEKRKKTFPAISAIMAQEWKDQATLASIQSYLKQNIERLTEEIHKEKNEAMLPVYVPVKFEPEKEHVDAKGKPLKKVAFDYIRPSNEELAEVWDAMFKHTQPGVSDEELFKRCHKEWFLAGVNDKTLELRMSFLVNYIDDLRDKSKQRLYKPKPPSNWKPTDAENEMLRQWILKHRVKGDTYNTIIAKCMNEWTVMLREQRAKASPITDALLGDLVNQLYQSIFERAPTASELTEHKTMVRANMEKLGYQEAIDRFIQTLILNTEFVFRNEFGQGTADEHGRKMLSPRDASYAIAYALTDSGPDKELLAAANSGKLVTREDYKREVTRILKSRNQYYLIDEAVERIGGADSFTNMPIRKMRFFREFFGYPNMLPIFKDNKRFGGDYTNTVGRLVSEADMLVEHIVEKDKNVFEELLTTKDFYVFHSGDNQAMEASAQRIRKIYDYFKDKNWQDFTDEDLKQHTAFLDEIGGMRGVDVATIGNAKGKQDATKNFKLSMASFAERFGKGQTSAAPYDAYSAHGVSEAMSRTGKKMGNADVARCFDKDLSNWNYPATQPARMENRSGILTHPAWLIAHAANTATDPIRRGKWVREKLLAGSVPDVPITVDAVIPEDAHNTLRTRLEEKTKAEYCWGCHVKMNPLGLTFEMYDDFGRFRTQESLEYPENLIKKVPDKGAPHADLRDIYKTLPVNSKGHLEGTDDPKLDGELKDALDLSERLAKSTKVRQSIIRHAFRYFMGRNEFLSDSKTLIDADQAYVQSGGSFDAVIISLLTSDSFIYRKANTN